METKFTKGDWKATIAELKDFFLCAVGSVETKRVICHTNLDPEITSEECKANAKLIAAAPDLFEAAEMSKQFIEYIKNAQLNLWSDKMQLMYESLCKLDSAIKKATE